ncbi:srf-type transcription factor [Grosmannia clavigera kw1407]|uniref:MADS-box MEF2 type transcription factor MIG1 n=1 Tax=Grosmannia clavigera (strain kw1407 / UAMH 11150) TaxID=655863 RepID=F0XAH6_GROCL|nr:srf-type transcription factor [Grosmannia clavigera kw1407]EFX05453.1 srf-type transcription factor [Grosmannia clavigera kw1407]
MGRRKIEIKAIKDDRNRSVTFLKRKGGLFKKAHELSVLCSVDVAVFIFGSNKKLYEYSSGDMRDLIARYTYHGGPNEHKGPSDFNGGADDGSDDEVDGSPPMQPDGMDPHMMAQHYPGQPQQFAHLRHHTPSASPPIPNGVTFASHASATQAMQRGHTPQPPQGISRPGSRNDVHRVSQNGLQASQGPPPGHSANGYAYMPHPSIYNPQAQQNAPQPNMQQVGPSYPYAPQQQNHGPPSHPHMQSYVDDRPSSLPPSFPQVTQAPGSSLPPPPLPPQRHSVSPPQAHSQRLPHPPPRASPRPSQSLPPPPQNQGQAQVQHPSQSPPEFQQPQSQPQPQIQEPQPPTPVDVKSDAASDWPEVKKLPQRKQYSIFTPIDESRSILSQHLAAFHSDSVKTEPQLESPPSKKMGGNESVDSGNASRGNKAAAQTAKNVDGSSGQLPQPKGRGSVSSVPETVFTPPSRQNSLRSGPLRPRLRVEIPPDGSEDSGGTGTGGSASSPRNGSDTGPSGSRRNGDHAHGGMVLPPPSPSASSLLSAGATGPPNPFARPPPHQGNNGGLHVDTPGSALPSRFLNNELLPSPNSFYPDWGFGRNGDSATLPSPLNFATPVVGTGPSFLRDDHVPAINKRKSPEIGANAPSSDSLEHNEAKRVKVDS